MKKWLAFVSVAASILFLFGCNKSSDTGAGPAPGGQGRQTTSGKAKPIIGVSLLTLENPFFKEMGDAMQAEGAKNGYDVTVEAGENDPARQKDQVKDFIVKKVSAIVLTPCDSRAIATSIAEANQAGIPVFTADVACLDKTVKVVSHIATDNYEGGKMAGQGMVEALNGRGTVAIIDHPAVESVQLRTKGFQEIVGKSPGIKIVTRLEGMGLRDASFKTAQDILQQNPQLDGIFAINDPSAMGAIAAIEKANRAGKIKIIGFDGQPEAKQAIKDGKIYADAIQFPTKIAEMTIQSIQKYLAGEQVPPQQLIPTGLYKKADADKDSTLK